MSEESPPPQRAEIPATIPQEQIVVAQVVEPPPARPARRRDMPNWLLPLALFLMTCRSTWEIMGPKYAAALMTILVCHEAGHFFQARRYGVPTSFPFFIPLPYRLIPNFFGTMGAVIAMDPRIPNRKALFDIGATGPLFGLLPTLICCYVGLSTDAQWMDRAQVRPGIEFGDPLLLQWMAGSILGPMPENSILIIGPVAMAGYVGLLVTSLNLIPIGQLDGGHVLYAILGRRAHPIARLLLVGCAIGAIVYEFYWWILMLVLLTLFGPAHPPTHCDTEPLGLWRSIVGWALLAFVVIGFAPNLIVEMPGK